MLSRLIFKYFTQKKCKLTFRKHSVYKKGSWYDVKDSYLMESLKSLQDTYSFTILKMDFTSYRCTVIIKCNKADQFKIFTDFCAKADEYITEVQIS